ncbi:hypothetical protein J7T55_012410 [Diaporthe amygdali]|uniref:uncharacterized protein n=1 Tax=Phomopsis amygdali TaxID=1214568 RepID=UPI0022FDC49A|nr:uncharacterized protein J7T55_012410 [Diaporthe amygdali]KAJ0123938.1 hypothetical protein J7T55_012410 [Diaporthe amygdali]
MHLSMPPLLFGLLGTVHAFHFLPRRSMSDDNATDSSEFSLAMKLNGTYASLNAIYLSEKGILLQAQNMSDYSGTPTYLNSTESDDPSDHFPDSLVLNLTNTPDISAPPGVYGVAVASLGDAHGAWVFVSAIQDEQEFDFLVTDGSVYHELTAAPQSWFACSQTVENVTGTFLSWGVYDTNGSAPFGCEVTDVVQNFNVPGRAKLELF